MPLGIGGGCLTADGTTLLRTEVKHEAMRERMSSASCSQQNQTCPARWVKPDLIRTERLAVECVVVRATAAIRVRQPSKANKVSLTKRRAGCVFMMGY